MARILIGSIYFLRLDPARWREHQPFPPLGTLYAAAVLRRSGHEVHLFDAMIAKSVSDWDTALKRTRPDVAVLFDDNFNYLSKMCLSAMRNAAFAMIAAAKASAARVAVCSADASDHPATYLDAGADAVAVGEGEMTIEELVCCPDWKDAGPSAIKGIVYRDAIGEISRTPPRELQRDLDSLPLPAWDLVDISAYRNTWMRHHGFFALNLVTSRGCPYRCNWCAKPIWGRGYAARSPASVVAELSQLMKMAAPDYIWFMDDIMGLRPGWWRTFADALARAGLHIPFKCLSRADLLLRDGTIGEIKRAGCDIVWMGAESGSQAVLDAMDKEQTVREIVEATGQLKRAGIRVGHFIQFGYPGEGMKDIGRTLSMLRSAKPDEIGISVSYPLAGTAFHARVERELRNERHWAVSSDMAMLYRGPFTTAFYRQLHTYVHRDFRMRRAVQKVKGAFNNRKLRNVPVLRAALFVLVWTAGFPVSWLKLQLLRLMPHSALPNVREAA
ncbi:MAG: B12-binding domain-containing radical SAM protein [Alphaproteobacteria bacterium]|nr:B12-binding domain-containing radical SAM protein [Alphaproteobacteria bacterium]